jgi:2-hydroxychromene-2-carboxylate isomerase
MKFEFWFDFSCPYAYIASTKIEALAARTGAELDVRPMLLGGVFKARGVAQNLASTLGPAKAQHNLNDMRRQAQRAGVELRMPAGHPLRTVEALRCVLAAANGRPVASVMPLIHRIYRAYWVDNEDIGQREVLARALGDAGFAAGEVLQRAESAEIKDELRRRTEEAVARGVFGVPTLFVGDELFWGQDRMDMVEEALGGRVAAPQVRPSAPVDFYFDYSSPFSYIAAARAEQAFGAVLRWRPILLGGLFRQIGTADVPLFEQSPEKRRHTMQDLDRQARQAGVIFKFPTRFPIRTVLPLRATIAAGSPPALVRALGAALWAEDRDISDPAVVREICERVGLDGEKLVAQAETPEVKAGLLENTKAAETAGVFGVPTFVVHAPERGALLYWGNDRLQLAASASAGETSAM